MDVSGVNAYSNMVQQSLGVMMMQKSMDMQTETMQNVINELMEELPSSEPAPQIDMYV